MDHKYWIRVKMLSGTGRTGLLIHSFCLPPVLWSEFGTDDVLFLRYKPFK